LTGDSTDADQRRLGLWPNRAEQLRPDELEIRLGLCREHRADRDVIGTLRLRLSRLGDAVGRAAQHHAWVKERPGGAGGQIVLAEVTAVGAEGDGRIDPVVPDER